ncbi:MAG: hypothetical protein V4574_21855 [Pseudomonadota bacterium]
MTMIPAIGRIAAIAAAVTLAIGTPVAAFADPIPTPAKAAPKARATAETRYCVEREVIGSRLTRRTCKTRDAWLRSDHYDPAR